MSAEFVFLAALKGLLGEIASPLFIKGAKGLFKLHKRWMQDPFLNYSPGFLIRTYANEQPIYTLIPYCEVCNWIRPSIPETAATDENIVVQVLGKRFRLRRRDRNWKTVSEAGFLGLKKSGRIEHNEPTIRLLDAYTNAQKTTLVIQEARYHDQARSNLILDWKPPQRLGRGLTTLREQLEAKYGHNLPPLSDVRLANTIGIAALVFFFENRDPVPYLVRRVKQVAVHPGGLTATASGAVKWDSQATAFSEIFTKDMYNELWEEVGLSKEDLCFLVPVALCREFLRGGKPQVFFVGLTKLSREDLKEKRIHARKVSDITGDWPEVERDRWYRSADVVISHTDVMRNVYTLGLNLEAIASVYYGLKVAHHFQ